MGRAHVKIAALQEDFAQSFCDTFLGSMDILRETMKEYAAQRKKLESRRYVVIQPFRLLLLTHLRNFRIAYEAAMSRVSKAKKEKEKKDAEEEMKIAKSR